MSEPKFSFIVPVYKTELFLERCIDSLLDQNYTNKEIIVVLDGDDKIYHKVLKKYKESEIKILIQDHKGACAARNTGFKASTGDIVSFFNSDYIANPGMVRKWYTAFKENPAFDFIYGAYGWNAANMGYYASEPFDQFILNNYNYIDCGFPLKKEYVVEWDENCKSLQDWDFWLRVIKNGAKGFYLGNDISYVAELPRPGGLSYDSHGNWLERVNYIKDKLQIPINKIVVSSLGAANHGKEIAKMIGADFKFFPGEKQNDYKMLYLIGCYPKSIDQHSKVIAGMNPDCKVVIHWVGADIFWLRKFTFEELKYITGALTEKVWKHLCENEQAQKELAMYGIKAEVCVIPPYRNDYEIFDMPKDFTVGLFLTNKSDFDKYAKDMSIEIMLAMPDINWLCYGDAATKEELGQYPHIKYLGIVDNFTDYVKQCSCLLRLVHHDTLPLAACEFFMCGRPVVTNIPLDYAEYVNTGGTTKLNDWDVFGEGFADLKYPETKGKVIDIIRKLKLGGIDDHKTKTAKVFYDTLCDKKEYVETIHKFLKEKK